MSTQLQTQHKITPEPSFMPVRTGLLQRRCACGQNTGGSECKECRQKHEAGSRRAALNSATIATNSPMAHNSSPLFSQPLDQAARIFNESRFAYDFSKIQTHTDATNARVSGAGNDPQDAGVPDAALNSDASVSTPDAGTSDAGTSDAGTSDAGKTFGPLAWSQVLLHKNDALWFFCGEHPSGFSISTTLRASGFNDPTLLTWNIKEGADKVAFQGPATGSEVVIKSKAGSTRSDDVAIEAAEGTGATARSFTGRLSVRKPHRFIHRFDNDQPGGGCPPFAACAAACPAYWTEIGYRILDNLGGTIVGATVNENFPGAKTDDRPNNWPSPAAFATVPFWANTLGTFEDEWFISCGNPPPVAPADPNAAQSVDHMPHEFFVGSRTPGLGCRVQTQIAHRYLGFTRHEGIVTPAP